MAATPLLERTRAETAGAREWSASCDRTIGSAPAAAALPLAQPSPIPGLLPPMSLSTEKLRPAVGIAPERDAEHAPTAGVGRPADDVSARVRPTTRHDPAEAALVMRLKALDEAAIREVYRQHADAIYRYALYQSGDQHIAEDVAGEVFVRLMESISGYTYRGVPISAWLYRIARNLVVDHQRRGNRLRPLEAVEHTRAVSDNPVELAEKRLGWEELRNALGELTDEQREVVVLKFVEDLQNQEVAAIVGKNEGSVKALQHRALRSLRRVLERRGQHG